jgi:hypothetical protein
MARRITLKLEKEHHWFVGDNPKQDRCPKHREEDLRRTRGSLAKIEADKLFKVPPPVVPANGTNGGNVHLEPPKPEPRVLPSIVPEVAKKIEGEVRLRSYYNLKHHSAILYINVPLNLMQALGCPERASLRGQARYGLRIVGNPKGSLVEYQGKRAYMHFGMGVAGLTSTGRKACDVPADAADGEVRISVPPNEWLEATHPFDMGDLQKTRPPKQQPAQPAPQPVLTPEPVAAPVLTFAPPQSADARVRQIQLSKAKFDKGRAEMLQGYKELCALNPGMPPKLKITYSRDGHEAHIHLMAE